jgi:hypothetical protein
MTDLTRNSFGHIASSNNATQSQIMAGIYQTDYKHRKANVSHQDHQAALQGSNGEDCCPDKQKQALT